MESPGRKPHRILIFLDTLLDTRLPVMKKIGKEWPERVIKTKKYLDRESDIFSEICPSFPDEPFKVFWKARTTEDIMGDVFPTFLNACLYDLVHKQIVQSADDPHLGHVEMTINTYPYEMDSKGKEILKAMCESNFSSPCSVCYIPYDLVTPAYVSNSFDDMFIYEFDTWLNLHHRALINKPIPHVSVYAPLLRATKKKSGKYKIMDDKEFMEHNWMSHIKLTYLSAGTFSMFVLGNKKDPE